MIISDRPLLADQHGKVSLLNYFLACFVGCLFASTGAMIWSLIGKIESSGTGLIQFVVGTILMSTFALPYAFLGLLPLSAVAEFVARKTTIGALTITGFGAAGAAVLGKALMPQIKFEDPNALGAIFGVAVFGMWALFTFYAGGTGAHLASKQSRRD